MYQLNNNLEKALEEAKIPLGKKITGTEILTNLVFDAAQKN